MARTDEQKLYDRMKANKPPRCKLERIENAVGEGEPDVRVFGWGGWVSWVELKFAKRANKRPTTPALGHAKGMRQSQMNWIAERTQRGINCFILIADDCGRLYLMSGHQGDLVNDMTARELLHNAIVAGIEDYPLWVEIYKHIYKELK